MAKFVGRSGQTDPRKASACVGCGLQASAFLNVNISDIPLTHAHPAFLNMQQSPALPASESFSMFRTNDQNNLSKNKRRMN